VPRTHPGSHGSQERNARFFITGQTGDVHFEFIADRPVLDFLVNSDVFELSHRRPYPVLTPTRTSATTKPWLIGDVGVACMGTAAP
jgi:hypothetical protein